MRPLLISASFLLLWQSPAAQPEPLPKTPLTPARLLLLKGDHENARKEFEKLLADEKHGPAAAIGISRAWRSGGDADKAKQAIEAALKTFSDHPDLLAARAELAYSRGDWNDALKDVEAALKKNPDHFPARWVRARIYRDSGKLAEADAEMRWFVRAYTAASNADKDITDPELLLIVGQAGAENARWNNISRQFSFIINEVYADILKLEPANWQAEWLIGEMLLEKYNRPDAIEAFDKALKLNPNAAEPYVGKGVAAMQRFELKDAEEFAEEALKRNPKLGSALRLKADIQILGGQFGLAESTLREALAVNSKDEVAHGKLAACYKLMKRIDEANAIEIQVNGYDKKPGVFLFELGEALESRREYTNAEPCFRKAIEQRPMLAGPRTSLGMLRLRLGDEAEGRKILDAAFQADKFNVRVANMRKVLEHLDKYQTIRTEHYDLKFDPEKDKLLGEFVAEYLEEVHADLKKQFQFEPQGRLPVEVFSKHEMFSGRTVGLPDLHTIGACTGRVVAMASPKAQGIRKPFNWGRVIRHEMVHVFNLAQTDYQCPHWLTEGLAVRNEKIKRPPLWLQTLRDAADEKSLFTLDTVMLGFVKPKNPSQWMLAYCQSQLYVEYVVKKHGEETIAKLLKAYAEGKNTDEAILAACGMEKAAVEAGYLAYVNEILEPIRKVKKAAADKTASMTLAQLEAAKEKEPENWDVKARLAEQYLKRSKPNEARNLADEVLGKKPGHPLASVVRARLLLRAGEDEQAKKVLDAALKQSPEDPRLLLAFGRIALETKEYDLAAKHLEAGRLIAPLDGDWLEQLARVYTESKNNAKLRSVFEEIAANDADDLETRLKLVPLLLELNDAKAAVVVAKEAMQIDITDEAVQKLYLESLEKSGGDAATMRKRLGK